MSSIRQKQRSLQLNKYIDTGLISHGSMLDGMNFACKFTKKSTLLPCSTVAFTLRPSAFGQVYTTQS